MNAREKWEWFLKGDDVGPLVSPLCDGWSLDIPYVWPFEEPDPFPPGHPQHALSEQMAMAGVCGWDPTFLASVPMPPRDGRILPRTATTRVGGATRSETRTWTPLGDLVSIAETMKTTHAIKHDLATEEDYRRRAWLTRARLDYDEAAAVREGRLLREAVGDRGVLGTWFDPPVADVNYEEMFYHMADWPGATAELVEATRALRFKQVETLRRAGFDYLFYCVSGTEWYSPSFFVEHVLADSLALMNRWRESGGFVLWHTCGQAARLIEAGVYNQCRPDIFETVSEPPVGNVPSLRWARERLDPAIATKGNMPLDILLNGTPDQVRADVARIKEQTRGCRHIVGLSDDILAGTPVANARAMVEEARRTP